VERRFRRDFSFSCSVRGDFRSEEENEASEVRASDPHPRVLDESRSREEVSSRFLAPPGSSAARTLAATFDANLKILQLNETSIFA